MQWGLNVRIAGCMERLPLINGKPLIYKYFSAIKELAQDLLCIPQ
jgi:hypothetical protein